MGVVSVFNLVLWVAAEFALLVIADLVVSEVLVFVIVLLYVATVSQGQF